MCDSNSGISVSKSLHDKFIAIYGCDDVIEEYKHKLLLADMETSKGFQGIPIISELKAVEPVYQRFGLKIGDPNICIKIIDSLMEIIQHPSIEKFRVLYGHETQNVTEIHGTGGYLFYNLERTYSHFYRHADRAKKCKGDVCYDWLNTKARLFVKTLEFSREFDNDLQVLLNYQKYATEFDNFSFLLEEEYLARIYELRGIDFFLYYYCCGESDINLNPDLFDGGVSVVKSLKRLNRDNEAEQVNQRLQQIQKNITAVP